jgi:oxygen-dependent protoporphyrinogen oxidase
MKKLVVVGGGISGVATAWAAERAAKAHGLELEITVLEKDDAVGGKARTVFEKGWMVETGPLGFLGSEPSVGNLASEVGMADKLQSAGAAAAHRFIARNGVMKEVPTNPLKFFFSGHLSPFGTLRILGEPLVSTPSPGDEESIWHFCARRFGKGVADRLVHPMVLGVFAGDSSQIAMKAAFPMLPELEAAHGSVIRGFIAKARAGKKSDGPKPKRGLRTFSGGIQSLPLALVKAGDFSVRTSSLVERVALRDGRWSIALKSGDIIEADAVVMASEAFATADAIEPNLPELARSLREIPYPPVAVVGLGYTGEDAARIREGFGVLIPRSDKYRILGVTWDSKVFPGRTPGDGVLVRAMLGGTYDTAIGQLGEEEIAEIAGREVAELMGLSGRPSLSYTKLWHRAIPQYDLGHIARVSTIERLLSEAPGLWIAGNSLYGSSFGKAASRGIDVGGEVVGWLQSEAGEVS